MREAAITDLVRQLAAAYVATLRERAGTEFAVSVSPETNQPRNADGKRLRGDDSRATVS